LKYTPYIYSLFFFFFSLISFSQKGKQLLIEGANKNSKLVISQLHYTKTGNDSLLNAQIDFFTKRIESLGFINYQIENSYSNDSIYYYKIDLKTPVLRIKIETPHRLSLSEVKTFKPSTPNSYEIDYTDLSLFMEAVVKHFTNNGHAFTQVSLGNLRKDNDKLIADLILKKGHRRAIDKIIVNGYENFPTAFIKQQLNLSVGSVFNEMTIRQLSIKTKQISFVDEIRRPELLFQQDSTSIYLYLKKKKNNHFDGVIGFSNRKKKKGIQLNGYLNFKIVNLFNKGESFHLNWLADGAQSQRLDLAFDYPYIYKTPLSIGYSFNLLKKDSTFVNVSNLLKTNYKLAQNNKIGLTLEYTSSNSLIKNTRTINFKNFFYGVFYQYNQPTNHPIHKNKWYIYSLVATGERNSEKQFKIENHIFYLQRLNKRHYISLQNKTAMLVSKNYLDNELFRIGGSTSLHGFNENSLYTKRYSYLNLEYSYLVGNASYLSVLGDYALLNLRHQKHLTQAYSFGLGYNFKTKAGRLGVQYFIGNTDQAPFSFGNAKLHIRLIQRF